jgi:hypothetical protein
MAIILHCLTIGLPKDELFSKMAEHLGLQYRYEDQNPLGSIEMNHSLNSTVSAGRTQTPALAPADLQVMPPDWLAALQKAAQHCDDEEVSYLIAQIPAAYPALIAGLNHLAHGFQSSKCNQYGLSNVNVIEKIFLWT